MKHHERYNYWVENKLPGLLVYFPARIFKILEKINFVPKIKNWDSCYMFGQSHTGKTVKACEMIIEWHLSQFIQCKQADFIFTNTINLLEELRSAMNDMTEKNRIMSNLKNTHLLVLDDLGVEKTTDWAYQMLYDIIDYRFNHELTSFYTSNLSIEELSIKLKDDRIPSRIYKDCKRNIIEFTHKPY